MKIRLWVGNASCGSEWEYSGNAFEVGRSPECRLSIPDEGNQVVSWQHARFELLTDHATVTDLKSTNGTWLNGAPIRGATRLEVGDEIRLGQSGPQLIVQSLEAFPVPQRRLVAAVAKTEQPLAASAMADSSTSRVVLWGRPSRSTAIIASGAIILIGSAVWLTRGTTQPTPTAVRQSVQSPPRVSVSSQSESTRPAASTEKPPLSDPLPQLEAALQTLQAELKQQRETLRAEIQALGQQHREIPPATEKLREVPQPPIVAVVSKQSPPNGSTPQRAGFSLPPLRLGDQLGKVLRLVTQSDDAPEAIIVAASSLKRKLHYTDPKFLHEIESGRALNRLLDILAPGATEHQAFLLELERSERAVQEPAANEKEPTDKKTIENQPASSATSDTTSAHRVGVNWIRSLARSTKLAPATIAELRFENGTQDVRQIVRGNSDPLPLEWPIAIRQNPQYAPLMAALEAAKATATEELSAPASSQLMPGLSVATIHALTAASDELSRVVHQDVEAYFEALRQQATSTGSGVPVNKTALEYVRAMHFLRESRMGIARLVEARNLNDVTVSFPPLDEAGAPRPVTIQELLSFMALHSLRFAAADANGKLAYQQVFREQYEYYIDLAALRTAVIHHNPGLLTDREQAERAIHEHLIPWEQSEGLRTSASAQAYP